MAKNKCTNLYDGLLGVVNTYGRNDIKIALGDSIDNNRTLTVSQVIRYLNTKRKFKSLGLNLGTAFNLLRSDILAERDNFRTDAVDINEFLLYFEMYILNVPGQVRTFGRELTQIAV